MNNACYGDRLRITGQDYYRCLLDGTVLNGDAIEGDPCGNCGRTVKAAHLNEPEMRITQRHEFKHPEFGWVEFLAPYVVTFDSVRSANAFPELVEALRFYADPKAYEVVHSKDPDVCDSTHCGCSGSPITWDEGEMARALLSKLEAEQ